jgi:hypothetical protein
MKKLILAAYLFFAFNFSFGQYNACAGKSEVRETVIKEVKDEKTGEVKREEVKQLPQTAVQDAHGNLKRKQIRPSNRWCFQRSNNFCVKHLWKYDGIRKNSWCFKRFLHGRS